MQNAKVVGRGGMTVGEKNKYEGAEGKKGKGQEKRRNWNKMV